MRKLTKAQVKYVDENLKEKTIFKIARELTEKAKLKDGERITRRDIISFFKEKFKRDLVIEKFGPKK
jgi:hypothetical protein